MLWKGLKTAQKSSLLLTSVPNLELLLNQLSNKTPENNNDPENISPSKYYYTDEIHNIEIPNKN